jgi:tetratricopeptide (TPR) repeat protein
MSDGQNIPTPSGLRSWALDDAHASQLLQFERLMKATAGFTLVLLQYNDSAYRDNLIPYLEQYAQSPGRMIVEPDTPFHIFEEQLAALSANHDLVQVLGLNQWLSGKERAARVRGFNYHRELIAERVHTMVALWLIEDDIRAIALDAPDMWAWRSGVLDFSVMRQLLGDLINNRMVSGNSTIKECRQRIEEIETFLAANPELTISRAMLLMELGQVKTQLGLLDDALQSFAEAGAIYRQLEYKRDLLSVQGEIARIYVEKGDVDRALKLNEEGLEIYKELKNGKT